MAGEKQFAKAAAGIKLLWPTIDQIVSSELTRAKKTAEILKISYPKASHLQSSVLNDDSSVSKLLSWVKTQDVKTLALVGHEPLLSKLALLLLSSDKGSIKLKKGGLIHLELTASSAVLQCVLTQNQLELIGAK